MSSTPTSPASKLGPPLPGLVHTFRALRHREFRLLWLGLAVSAVGTWMQIVAQSLLVLKITHGSAFALGCVSLAQAAAFFLFALLGGTVADRIDKRRLLLFTQSGSAILAMLLGFLTLFGVIQLWMILVVSFLNGTLLSFDQPTRAALVSVLVPRKDLGNAISLQSMIFNGASTVGPALAGFSVATLGYAGNFFLNAASFIGVLGTLYVIRVPHVEPRRESPVTAIWSGLDTVRSDPVLPWALLGYGAILFLGPSAALVLPVFAVNILRIGPEPLGFLFSAAGAGTIAGAVLIASLRHDAKLGRIYLAGIFIWVAGLATFAVSRHFWISFATLFVFGVAQTLVGTTTITLLQTRVSPQMRGRVMSLNTLLLMGVRPLGDFPIGGLMALIGAPATILISAGLVAGTGSLLAVRTHLRDV